MHTYIYIFEFVATYILHINTYIHTYINFSPFYSNSLTPIRIYNYLKIAKPWKTAVMPSTIHTTATVCRVAWTYFFVS